MTSCILHTLHNIHTTYIRTTYRKEVREYERQQRIAIEQLEMARARRMAMEEEVCVLPKSPAQHLFYTCNPIIL